MESEEEGNANNGNPSHSQHGSTKDLEQDSRLLSSAATTLSPYQATIRQTPPQPQGEYCRSPSTPTPTTVLSPHVVDQATGASVLPASPLPSRIATGGLQAAAGIEEDSNPMHSDKERSEQDEEQTKDELSPATAITTTVDEDDNASPSFSPSATAQKKTSTTMNDNRKKKQRPNRLFQQQGERRTVLQGHRIREKMKESTTVVPSTPTSSAQAAAAATTTGEAVLGEGVEEKEPENDVIHRRQDDVQQQQEPEGNEEPVLTMEQDENGHQLYQQQGPNPGGPSRTFSRRGTRIERHRLRHDKASAVIQNEEKKKHPVNEDVAEDGGMVATTTTTMERSTVRLDDDNRDEDDNSLLVLQPGAYAVDGDGMVVDHEHHHHPLPYDVSIEFSLIGGEGGGTNRKRGSSSSLFQTNAIPASELEHETHTRLMSQITEATVMSKNDDVDEMTTLGYRKRRCWLGCIGIVAIVFTIVTVFIVLGTTSKNDSNNVLPPRPMSTPPPPLTTSPTNSPTGSPTTLPPFPELTREEQSLLGILLGASSDGGVMLRTDPTSAQYQAFTWLAETMDHGIMPLLGKKAITERYAITTVYFAMNGSNWLDNDDWLDPELHICNWVSLDRNECRLEGFHTLDLTGNHGSGSIPKELGLLENLQRVQLGSQRALIGHIPTELFLPPKLSTLELHSNDLSGSIPTWIGQSTNLQAIYLHQNQLSGTLPTEIGKLQVLQNLVIRNNLLSGTIPSEVGQLSSLRDFGTLRSFWCFCSPVSPFCSQAIRFLETHHVKNLPPFLLICSFAFSCVARQLFLRRRLCTCRCRIQSLDWIDTVTIGTIKLYLT